MTFSMLLSVATVLFLALTGETYATVLAFLFFVLKVILYMRGRQRGKTYIYSAKYTSKLFENISENILIQDGVYGWVRNPVYSAAFFISMGAVCMTNRLLLLVVVGMICWSYMSLLLVVTEEKWLRELYGKQYEVYFHSVNRCIPWFSKK